MLKVVPNLAHEVHHFHSPGFLHYLWMATSSHSISKPLLASTWTTSTLIKDSGSAWSTKTLEYFRIMPKIAPKFQDFFGICEDDIILNEDTQEFLSLDLPTLFYSNEIDFQSSICVLHSMVVLLLTEHASLLLHLVEEAVALVLFVEELFLVPVLCSVESRVGCFHSVGCYLVVH